MNVFSHTLHIMLLYAPVMTLLCTSFKWLDKRKEHLSSKRKLNLLDLKLRSNRFSTDFSNGNHLNFKKAFNYDMARWATHRFWNQFLNQTEIFFSVP